MIEERISKYLASCNLGSRRKCEDFVRQGLIKINGEVITDLSYKVKNSDKVLFNDKEISKVKEKIYLLLNKPNNIICTSKDTKNRTTVVSLIPEKYSDYRLYPVGRLDFNTSGLILLTNDGDLTYRLTHPKHEIEKEYQVSLDKIFNVNDFKKLIKGINVKDYFVKPKNLEVVQVNKESNTSLVRITITEGKKHEVRDIFKTLGYRVKKLVRIRLAFLTIEDLKQGDIRPLKIHEIKKLYSL